MEDISASIGAVDLEVYFTFVWHVVYGLYRKNGWKYEIYSVHGACRSTDLIKPPRRKGRQERFLGFLRALCGKNYL
jgi:hypothetical protein